MSEANQAGPEDVGPPPDILDRPETGDLVIDAVIGDLAACSPTDLDDLVDAGERVQRTLQGRLADLGG